MVMAVRLLYVSSLDFWLQSIFSVWKSIRWIWIIFSISFSSPIYYFFLKKNKLMIFLLCINDEGIYLGVFSSESKQVKWLLWFGYLYGFFWSEWYIGMQLKWWLTLTDNLCRAFVNCFDGLFHSGRNSMGRRCYSICISKFRIRFIHYDSKIIRAILRSFGTSI